MSVPMLELAPQNASVKEQILQGLSGLIDRSSFILGENVKGLEAELAAYSGGRVRHRHVQRHRCPAGGPHGPGRRPRG